MCRSVRRSVGRSQERALENSASTKARLEAELEKRSAELEKINTLDDKIGVELASLGEKIGSMRSEMLAFADVDGLRSSAEASKAKLRGWKETYNRCVAAWLY